MSKRINRDDVDKFHDYNLYIPKRLIYMGSMDVDTENGESGCDAAMAENVIKNLAILEGMSADPITIIMNNIGGDEYHCFAIFDAIKECKSHVTIKVMGHAMSAGSIILQAADDRIMAPTSRQMLHYGTWGVHDHAKTTQKWAREGERIDEWMEQLYFERIKAKNPSFKFRQIKAMLDHDTFLTAKESVDLGLADKVLGDEDSDE